MTASATRAGEATDGTADNAPRPFAVTHRGVLAIAAPMTLAVLTQPLLGITDTAVIGRLGDPAALGGLVAGALIFDFAFQTFGFVRAGTTGLVAQALGADRPREIEAVFRRAVILALGLGFGLVALQPLIVALGLLAIAPDPAVAEAVRTYVFWRMLAAPVSLLNFAVLGTVLGLGRGGLGLAIQVAINGANVLFSILFGLVLEGGVAGVAIGTATGEAVGAAIGLLLVLRGFRGRPHPTLREVLDAAGFQRMIAVNRDIMIRSFCLLGAFVLFARLGASLGAVTLAANGVLLNIVMVGAYFLDGLANASEQLVGRAVGARWRPAFDRAVALSAGWGFAMSAAMAALFLLVGGQAVAFLTLDAGVRAAAAPYLPYAALAGLAGAPAFLLDGVFIGATWTRAMRDMMIASTALFAALAYALTPLLGNHGLWLAFELFLLARGLSLLAVLPRRRRRTFG